MKKAILMLTLILPMTCFARFGWSFEDYSLLSGKQFRFENRPLWGFDIQYDRFISGCTRRSHYKGIGLNYSFNENHNEFGLKGMYNPTHVAILLTRTIRFYPYIFCQGNIFQTKIQNAVTNENTSTKSINFRPGIGLIGNLRLSSVFNMRTYVQIGYNIPSEKTQNFMNSCVLELKLGLGINSAQIKAKRKKSLEIELE